MSFIYVLLRKKISKTFSYTFYAKKNCYEQVFKEEKMESESSVNIELNIYNNSILNHTTDVKETPSENAPINLDFKKESSNNNKNNVKNSTLVSLNSSSEKLQKIKSRVTEILKNSSAHSIPNMIFASNLLVRLMWFMFFIGSTCACAYFTFDSISDYLKYHSLTTIKLVSEDSSQFPTISICIYPPSDSSTHKTIQNISFENVLENDIDRLLMKFYDPIYKDCFRINSGKNMYGETVDFLNSTISGYPGSLKISLHFEKPIDDFGEVLLNIHSHDSPPFDMENNGFWIKTGSWMFYEVSRVFTEHLGEPYSQCLKNVSTFSLNNTLINYILDSNRTYSQSDCFYLCSHLHAIEESNCSCNSSLSQFLSECIPRTDTDTEIKKCVSKYLRIFRQKLKNEKCQKYCPLECDSMSYFVTPYIENFPAMKNISEFREKDYDLYRYKTYEEVNKHHIVIYVYYKDLKYTLISQEAKSETFNFISNIGGILGLFLGISFLSFIEIVEIFLEISFILISK